jgi:hypothetical protein
MFKVFLPPAEMNAINEKTVTRALKYMGTCPKTKAFMLNIV